MNGLSVRIKEVDEHLFDDEVNLCLPEDSSRHAEFEKGIRDKRIWLKKRFDELGSVAQIAFFQHKPVAFIEYVSAEKAPIPTAENGKTALITCIFKPRFKRKGVGTALLKTALKRLTELGIKNVKALVMRDPHWITGEIYLKNGFRIERTFYKAGTNEPLDILNFDLKRVKHVPREIEIVKFASAVTDSLPIDVVYFCSKQCPFGSLVHGNLTRALGRFGSKEVVLELLDSWENCRLARECGSMYTSLFINGRAISGGPASEEKIEKEIESEINRIKRSSHTNQTSILQPV